MLLDSHCLVCRSSVGPLCVSCAGSLRPPVPRQRSLEGASGIPIRSLMAYEGVGRDLVTTIKYRNGRRLIEPLGPLMAELIGDLEPDVVTWVPASRSGRRQRGHDQGRLLSRATARHARVPVRGLLRRGGGPPQTGRPAAARADGPRLVCRRRGADRVLIVDDVVTTGASLARATAVLSGQGWQPVGAITVAATPRHPGPGSPAP